jgi:hypothetical protein
MILLSRTVEAVSSCPVHLRITSKDCRITYGPTTGTGRVPPNSRLPDGVPTCEAWVHDIFILLEGLGPTLANDNTWKLTIEIGRVCLLIASATGRGAVFY